MSRFYSEKIIFRERHFEILIIEITIDSLNH